MTNDDVSADDRRYQCRWWMMSVLLMDNDFSADDGWFQCWWQMISVPMMDDDVSAVDGQWYQCWWWMMMVCWYVDMLACWLMLSCWYRLERLNSVMMGDDVSADDGWWCYAGLCWYVGMLACWLMLSCWYRLERLNSIIFTIFLIPLVFYLYKYLCSYCLYLLLVRVIFNCFIFVLWIPLWIYDHGKNPFVLCNFWYRKSYLFSFYVLFD